MNCKIMCVHRMRSGKCDKKARHYAANKVCSSTKPSVKLARRSGFPTVHFTACNLRARSIWRTRGLVRDLFGSPKQRELFADTRFTPPRYTSDAAWRLNSIDLASAHPHRCHVDILISAQRFLSCRYWTLFRGTSC